MFFVVEVMSNGDNKIFYKKMAPIEIRGLLATINKQQKTRSMPFEPLSMDKSWTEAELKAFIRLYQTEKFCFKIRLALKMSKCP